MTYTEQQVREAISGMQIRSIGDLFRARMLTAYADMLAAAPQPAAQPAAEPDFRGQLERCIRFLADLNGSAWIQGDDAGAVDMRQRAKYLQQTAFAALAAAQQAEPHPPSRLCGCADCLPSFDDNARPPAAEKSPDANVEAVRAQLLERSKVGLRKYGVTTADNPLSLIEWLTHLQQELMDAAVYVEAAKQHGDNADPLQPAADWIVEATPNAGPASIGGRLFIGYNRAERLYRAAVARKGGA